MIGNREDCFKLYKKKSKSGATYITCNLVLCVALLPNSEIISSVLTYNKAWINDNSNKVCAQVYYRILKGAEANQTLTNNGMAKIAFSATFQLNTS